MFTDSEAREDLNEIKSYIESLEVKYGNEISCIVAAGVNANSKFTTEDDPDICVAMTYINGESPNIHKLCHCMLRSAKFVDEVIDAMKCVIVHQAKEDGKPSFLVEAIKASLDSLKSLLIKGTEEYAEYKASKDVEDYLKNEGFSN